MLKKIIMFFAMLGIGQCLVGAHSIWINMSSWNPDFGYENKAWTTMYIGWGHKFPVDGLTKRDTFDFIEMIDPNGKKRRVELDYEGISCSELAETVEGPYVLSLVRKPSIYNTYRENGQIKRGYGNRDDFPNVIDSLRTQQFSTAHFRVGKKVKNYKPKSVGNILELVPLQDPYEKDKNFVGALFPVQLIFDGKPLAYEQVTATYAGFSSTDSMAQRLLTDKDGIAYLRITHWGQWLLKAKAERPATEQFKSVADKEVYYTTLTFEI